MSVQDVLDAVNRYDCELIEITGGEPLLQIGVYALMNSLIDLGKTVLLETGGHRSIAQVPKEVTKVIDLKCPGSGESDKNCWGNIDLLCPHDQIKFVIADRDDFDYACRITREYDLPEKCASVLISPVHGRLILADVASWILAEGLPVRLQIQLHKFIWGADAKGV